MKRYLIALFAGVLSVYGAASSEEDPSKSFALDTWRKKQEINYLNDKKALHEALSLKRSFADTQPKGGILIITEKRNDDSALSKNEFKRMSQTARAIMPQASLSELKIGYGEVTDIIIEAASNPDIAIVIMPPALLRYIGFRCLGTNEEKLLVKKAEYLAEIRKTRPDFLELPSRDSLSFEDEYLEDSDYYLRTLRYCDDHLQFIETQCTLFEKLNAQGKIIVAEYADELSPKMALSAKRLLTVVEHHYNTDYPHPIAARTYYYGAAAAASLMLYWSLHPELSPDEAFAGFKETCIRPPEDPENYAIGTIDLNKL